MQTTNNAPGGLGMGDAGASSKTSASKNSASKNSGTLFLVGIVVVLAAVIMGPRLLRGGGSHETPAAFVNASGARVTLDAALLASRESGKPVLAYATASWCGPCQHFKATTLADAEVTEFITRNFEAAYVDVDEDPKGAQSLRVTSVPTLVVFANGEERGRVSGALDSQEFLRFTRAALGR
jgi:thioredoxin 1